MARRLVITLPLALCVAGGCTSGVTEKGHDVSVGKCQAQLVLRPGWIYGDVSVQLIAQGELLLEQHVAQVDMPPDAFEALRLGVGADGRIRTVIKGQEQEPYGRDVPLPARCAT